MNILQIQIANFLIFPAYLSSASLAIYLPLVRKGNILAQMTSTTTKRGQSNHYQESLLTTTKVISMSDQDISGISPLVNDSRTGLLDITPSVRKEARKTVSRKHIKSPVNNNKVLRKPKSTRGEDLEKQLKKKNLEALALNRKINKLEESLNEKNKIIKDLEIKFPKMLSELSRGLGKDPDKLKVSIELKDTIKRNRQLSESQERNEKLLKIKDDKIKNVIHERDKALDEMRMKEREVRELRSSLQALEEKVPLLVTRLEDREQQVRKMIDENLELKFKLRTINEDNIVKTTELEKLASEMVDLNLQMEDRECHLDTLLRTNEDLSRKLRREEEKVSHLEDKVSRLNQELVVRRFRVSLLTLTEDNVASVTKEEEDEVFDKMNIDEYHGDLSTASSSVIVTDASTVSESEYDVSAATLAKVKVILFTTPATVFRIPLKNINC